MTSRIDPVWIGLPLAALVAGAAIGLRAPVIETALRREAAARIGAAGLTDRLRLDVLGRDAVLVAEADDLSRDAVEAARRVLASTPGLRRVSTSVEALRPVDPFVFTLVRKGRDSALSGFVPPGDMRARIRADLRASSPDGLVDDRARTALGAPDTFDAAVTYGTRIVAALSDATLSIEDGRTVVRGEARDAAEYQAASALVRSAPPGLELDATGIEPPLVAPFTWAVSLDRSGWRLDGAVPSETLRDDVVKAAGDAVVDAMRTARGLDPAVAFPSLARSAIGWLRLAGEGRVALDGRTVRAEAVTAARDVAPGLGEALRSALPPGVTLAAVPVGVVPASPFRFEVSRRDGRVRLAGYMPAESDRSTIVAAAARVFPFEAVANELHLADGAPDGLVAAAGLALARLGRLADGEVRLSDRAVRLEGRSLYPEAAQRARQDFAAGWPAGWTAELRIEGPGVPGLDPAQCGDLLVDAGRREPIPFEPGRAEITPAGRRGIDAAVSVLRRCRDPRLAVLGWAAAGTDEAARRNLGRSRADAVAALLRTAEPRSAIVVETRLRPAGEPGPDAVTIEAGP